jgi:hypothetical protein
VSTKITRGARLHLLRVVERIERPMWFGRSVTVLDSREYRAAVDALRSVGVCALPRDAELGFILPARFAHPPA